MAEVAERSTVEILKAARERISDPERWTTREVARDAAGDPVEPGDVSACKWCAFGAVGAEAFGDDYCVAERFLKRAAMPTHVVAVNDSLGHATTLQMFDRAIQLAEQEAQGV